MDPSGPCRRKLRTHELPTPPHSPYAESDILCVIAMLVYERAKKQGWGTVVDLMRLRAPKGPWG